MQVITSARGRGTQMNAGARRATGDLLLFLHADSALPAGFEASVRTALERQSLRLRRPARSAPQAALVPQLGASSAVELEYEWPSQVCNMMRAMLGLHTHGCADAGMNINISTQGEKGLLPSHAICSQPPSRSP